MDDDLYLAGMDAMVDRIDDSYVRGRAPHLDQYLDRAERFIGRPISGVVADLGCGLGELVAVLSRRPLVQKVIGLDYSPAVIERARTRTLDALGADRTKVVLMVGLFEATGLPDGACDMVVEKNAFHHADDLEAVAHETFRVLRPGGWFVGIDRVLRDEVTNAEVEARLDQPLGQDLLQRYGFDRVVTRRDMHEHDHRRSDWVHAFNAAGFRTFVVQIFPLEEVSLVKRIPLKMFFMLVGDFLLQRRLTLFPYFNWFSDVRHCLVLCERPH